MSRRARATGFAVMALACAALSASLAGGYRGGVEAQLGALRPVVVARSEVGPGRPLRPADARELLEVRRVPERFVPADALGDPIEAVGLVPRAPVPAGSYLTGAVLRAPGGSGGPSPAVGAGREAVEITVVGAGALAAGGDPIGGAFDIVATSEPAAGGGDGHTRLVAEGVRLLALHQEGGAAGVDGLNGAPPVWTATVAAGRAEALRLIEAHNYAREVRLIGPGR